MNSKTEWRCNIVNRQVIEDPKWLAKKKKAKVEEEENSFESCWHKGRRVVNIQQKQ